MTLISNIIGLAIAVPLLAATFFVGLAACILGALAVGAFMLACLVLGLSL